MVRWLRAPKETFGAWSLMLLEGVRTLDEASAKKLGESAQHYVDNARRYAAGLKKIA